MVRIPTTEEENNRTIVSKDDIVCISKWSTIKYLHLISLIFFPHYLPFLLVLTLGAGGNVSLINLIRVSLLNHRSALLQYFILKRMLWYMRKWSKVQKWSMRKGGDDKNKKWIFSTYTLKGIFDSMCLKTKGNNFCIQIM